MSLLGKFFEILYLNICLLKIETKCLILRVKLYFCGLTFRKLSFQRRVLVVRKRNTLLEYGCGAMLVNKFFKPVKQSHEDTLSSNAAVHARAEPAGRGPSRGTAC